MTRSDSADSALRRGRASRPEISDQAPVVDRAVVPVAVGSVAEEAAEVVVEAEAAPEVSTAIVTATAEVRVVHSTDSSGVSAIAAGISRDIRARSCSTSPTQP